MIRNLSNSEDKFRVVVEEIISINNYGSVKFEFKNMVRIAEQKEYHGINIKLTGMIGRTRTNISVDFGVGDTVVPEAKMIKFETILNDSEDLVLKAYPLETIVAEKLDTIISLMEASSRMKDYYDIYYLATTKNFNGETLRAAIYSTTKNRDHLNIISNIYEIEKFKDNKKMIDMWNRFIEKELGLKEDYSKVLDKILSLTLPIVIAIEKDEGFKYNWNCREGKFEII